MNLELASNGSMGFHGANYYGGVVALVPGGLQFSQMISTALMPSPAIAWRDATAESLFKRLRADGSPNVVGVIVIAASMTLRTDDLVTVFRRTGPAPAGMTR